MSAGRAEQKRYRVLLYLLDVGTLALGALFVAEESSYSKYLSI